MSGLFFPPTSINLFHSVFHEHFFVCVSSESLGPSVAEDIFKDLFINLRVREWELPFTDSALKCPQWLDARNPVQIWMCCWRLGGSAPASPHCPAGLALLGGWTQELEFKSRHSSALECLGVWTSDLWHSARPNAVLSHEPSQVPFYV